ncbi:hypothetical protein LTR85_011453 [Meristemomyces frigidus]|nr:hypothetical protein LTR85_011453 [Meristemomyces frigidus]
MLAKTMVLALASSFIGLTFAHPHLHATNALSVGSATVTNSSPESVAKRDGENVCMSSGVAYSCDLATGGGIAEFPAATGLADLLADVHERDTADYVAPEDRDAELEADSILDARDTWYTMFYCNRLTPQTCDAVDIKADWGIHDLGDPGFTIVKFPAGLTCQLFPHEGCKTAHGGTVQKGLLDNIKGYYDMELDANAPLEGFTTIQSFRCGTE